MKRVKRTDVDVDKIRPIPALSPEAREQQLIAEATDEAERRILDGTASDTLLVAYIKQGTIEKRRQIAEIEERTELMRAKRVDIESNKKTDELYKNALAAMREYTGQVSESEVEFSDEDIW